MEGKETKVIKTSGLKIRNFVYDGIFGRLKSGFASYTGTFKEWTGDPGIALVACSDGRERLVPAFAIQLEKGEQLPPQPDYKEVQEQVERTGFHFGIPSAS